MYYFSISKTNNKCNIIAAVNSCFKFSTIFIRHVARRLDALKLQKYGFFLQKFNYNTVFGN